MVGIIGAGGHAKCVYECLKTKGFNIEGFFEDNTSDKGKEIIDDTVILGEPELIEERKDVNKVFVAIGDNEIRVDKFSKWKKQGYRFPNAIHRKAHISPFAKFGKGNFLMGASIINPKAIVGDYCIINTNATVGHDCELENGVQIAPGVNLCGGSKLKEGVFIGAGAVTAPKVEIGEWTIVGAGSVVLDDLPPNTFCYGTPARVVENI